MLKVDARSGYLGDEPLACLVVIHHVGVPPTCARRWGFHVVEWQGGAGVWRRGDLCVTGVGPGVAGTRLAWCSTSRRGCEVGSYHTVYLGDCITNKSMYSLYSYTSFEMIDTYLILRGPVPVVRVRGRQ